MGTIEVKVCGLTNVDDALFALEKGADFLGFVLHAGSPRGMDAARLARIRAHLPAAARVIGVFVNTARAEVERVAADCELYAAQLHGDERPEDFEGCPLRLWRALRVAPGGCEPDPAAWAPERYVADAAAPGKYGGTGTLADWSAAAALARERRLMLAGGLRPDNVGDAVRLVRPLGVDVSSGIESRPGHKDRGKLVRFILAARSAAEAP